MHGREALPTGPYLVCQPRFDVVEPAGPPTPAGDNDGLPGGWVVAHDFEDGLAVQPRLPPGVDEEEEPVAQQETETRVIEVDGQSQECAQ
jgi:hypothetical protein